MLKKSLIFVAIILFVALSLNAQVPQLINYQGVLTNASGNPLNGSFSINFSLYSVPSGFGVLLWSETQTIPVTDGLFNVLLGSITPIPYSVFNGADKYLAIKVGSDPEMTPRKRLVSVGYSYRAYEADKLDGKDAANFIQTSQANSISSGMIQDNSIASAKIQDGTITGNDISSATNLNINNLDVNDIDGGKNGIFSLKSATDVEITIDKNNNSSVAAGFEIFNGSGQHCLAIGETGHILAFNTIETKSGGYKFPDGTVQTTAAAGGAPTGIDYVNIGSSSNIPTSIRNLGSVSVNCPSSGYIIVTLSGFAVLFGDRTAVDIGLGTSTTSMNLNYTTNGRLDGSSTNRDQRSFSVQAVVPVSAGTKILYALAQKESVFSAYAVNLDNLYLTAIFIPNRY